MNMTEHQKDLILKIVQHYMTPELRARIMREAPVAYNAWHGRAILDVVQLVNGKSVLDKYPDM